MSPSPRWHTSAWAAPTPSRPAFLGAAFRPQLEKEKWRARCPRPQARGSLKHARLIRDSSPSGKTPTQIFPSSNKLKGNTLDCAEGRQFEWGLASTGGIRYRRLASPAALD